MSLRTCLLWLLFLICPMLLPAQDAVDGGQVAGPLPTPKTMQAKMTNDSVIRMVKAGLSDDLIVQTITDQPGQYNTDADALVTLKQAGASDRVIQSMVNKGRIRLTGSDPQPIVLSDVNEVGVYYKDKNGKWQAIEPDIVHEVSGGFLKSTATHGIIKEDRNGRVDGRESKLLLPRPIEFLIYTPEGVAASEYTMVLFRLHSNSREFRTWTGGVIHSTGGAKRDEVPFKAEKVAPRTYKFTLDADTPGGEYGILPPGTAGVGSLGKVYTFAISE
ncbi:MAG TPA: hypothetical protein VJU82_00065 [Acidobacteriaceae bacterium]|nr:hypothetical protein [Acidobacteriaceae bacterium]